MKDCPTTTGQQVSLVDEESDSKSPTDTTEKREEEDGLSARSVYLVNETEPRNEFSRTVTYNIRGKEGMQQFQLMTQIDTGCRISLLKG